MKFDDLSLRTKTLIPLVGMAVVFAGFIGAATFRLSDLTVRYGQIASGVEPAMLQTVRVTRYANKVVREAYGLLAYDRTSEWSKQVAQDFASAGAKGDNALDDAIRLNPAGASKYRALKTRFDALYEGAKAPVAIGAAIPPLTLGRALKPADLDQMAIGLGELEALDHQVTAFSRQMQDYNTALETANAREVASLQREAAGAVFRMVVVGGLAVVGALALAAWIARERIGAPLLRLGERMRRLAAGDLDVEIGDQARGDEIGAMARAVQVFKDNAIKTRALEVGLAASEARFRQLAEHTVDIILQLDLASVVVYASPSVRQLGYEPDELVGRAITDLIHPDDAAGARERLAQVVSGRPLAQDELVDRRLRAKDGRWVWVEKWPALVSDERGEPLGLVATIRDVSARRQTEDELQRQRAEAEAAGVAKADFLANMSHEIRTPLTSIIGFAGLLEKLDLPEEAQTYADRIAAGGQILLNVVNDVLDYSKIEAGQIELDPQTFDPVGFINDTVELVRAQAQHRGLALAVQVRGQMPAAIFADSARARQVLLNLLTNALKFTARGGVTIAMRYAPEDGGRLRIAVRDTGVGVPQDQVERLFQRFSQADGSVARKYGGSGLGLAICKRLAELMGGEIGVETEEGAGSTFWFIIAAPPALGAAPAAPANDAEPVWLRPARILLVDDVPVNRQLVTAMLAPFDLQLVEAASGAEAVEAASRARFDLILMDMQMPGMDGLEATRVIRATCELNRATPILALSANVLPAQVAVCRDAGMDDHIAKPIRPEELIVKIARWIARPATAETAQVVA